MQIAQTIKATKASAKNTESAAIAASFPSLFEPLLCEKETETVVSQSLCMLGDPILHHT